jgi:hypothetical protein
MAVAKRLRGTQTVDCIGSAIYWSSGSVGLVFGV